MHHRVATLGVLLLTGCGEAVSTPDLSSRDLMLFPSGCQSGDIDGDETDVDCGGSACGPCGAGKMCRMARDCVSAVCTNRVCEAPSCSDGQKNGRESDVDCGGDCVGCGLGRVCDKGSDCQSGTCTNNHCTPPPCMDMVQDGAETDVDCGGGVCAGCSDGRRCQQALDCAGMICTNNVCRSALMCMAGTADCDGDGGNGCEVNTDSDARNCGGCGKVCAGNLPTCMKGACVKAVKLLVLGADDPNSVKSVQQTLAGTGAFSTVDFTTGTPSLQQLMLYDAVLVYCNMPWGDPVAVGDSLADYVDAGRYVVTMYANSGGCALGGRFGTLANGYLLLDNKPANSCGAAKLGKVVEPMSPVINGVMTFGATSACRAVVAPVNGGIEVAQWDDGTPLVVRGIVKGRARVDLNYFPVNGVAFPQGWTGDGARLMRNALLFR